MVMYGSRRKSLKSTSQDDIEIINPNGGYGAKVDDAGSYVSALYGLFSRVNSTLAGRKVECAGNTNIQIAATDGETIYFNSEIIHKMFTEAIALGFGTDGVLNKAAWFRGLNYHELSHCLYTPRSTSTFMKTLKAELHQQGQANLFFAFNVLEDQRIESLFTSKFSGSIPYFQTTVLKFIVGKMEKDKGDEDYRKATASQWLLLHGRKYLPRHLVSTFEKKFVDEFSVSAKDMKTLKQLIDLYRGFVFPKDHEIAIETVKAFNFLVEKITNRVCPDSNTDGHDEHRRGQSLSAKEQREDQERRQQFDKTLDKHNEEQEEEQGGNSAGSDSEQGSESGQEDSEDGSSGDSSSDSDADSDSSGNSTSAGNSGHDFDNSPWAQSLSPKEREFAKEVYDQEKAKVEAAQRKQAENDAFGREVLEQLEQVLEQSQERIKQDAIGTIKQIRESVERNRFKQMFKDVTPPVRTVPPTTAYRILSNRISEQLGKLRADTDNQWERGTNLGNINIHTMIQSRGLHMDIFDQWVDEGDERPDAEIVILLDNSSSMQGTAYDYDKANALAQSPEWHKSLVYPHYWASELEHQSATGYTLVEEASFAMWAIKNACQQHDIPCTVIAYSDSAEVLMTSSMKVKSGQAGLYKSYGSTNPWTALTVAQEVMKNSDARHKLVVTITDGDWANAKKNSELVRQMNSDGIATVLLCLGAGFSVSRDINGALNGKIAPQYPSKVMKKIRDGVWDTKSNEYKFVEIPAGYGFKTVLPVPNCRALAKEIGKALVKGVVATR